MKRIDLLAAALLALTASTATAQTDSTSTTLQNKLDSLQRTVDVLQQKEDTRSQNEFNEAVWKRKKYLMIGYTTQTMKMDGMEDASKMKSTTGVSFNWGRTFYLHKKPIANVLKIGLDWSWLSMTYSKYKTDDIIADYESGDYGYDYDGYYDDEDDNPTLHSFDVGMSIGPSFTVSPFYTMGQGLQHILLRTYFHVTPSFTGILSKYDGDTEFYKGYTTYFKWGINVSYKVISVGYEYRWGSGKFSGLELNMDEDSDGIIHKSDTKPTYKFNASNVYVRFCF